MVCPGEKCSLATPGRGHRRCCLASLLRDSEGCGIPFAIQNVREGRLFRLPSIRGKAPVSHFTIDTIRLSVVIPCFNEISTLERVVHAVRAAPVPNKEIILVDDGSTDGTRELIRSKLEPLVARVVFHDRNRGKGAALRSGFSAAGGDVVIVQDADLEYDPSEYPRLIQPILDDQADVVFGSRFIGDNHRVLYFWHSVANSALTTTKM